MHTPCSTSTNGSRDATDVVPESVALAAGGLDTFRPIPWPEERDGRAVARRARLTHPQESEVAR